LQSVCGSGACAAMRCNPAASTIALHAALPHRGAAGPIALHAALPQRGAARRVVVGWLSGCGSGACAAMRCNPAASTIALHAALPHRPRPMRPAASMPALNVPNASPSLAATARDEPAPAGRSSDDVVVPQVARRRARGAAHRDPRPFEVRLPRRAGAVVPDLRPDRPRHRRHRAFRGGPAAHRAVRPVVARALCGLPRRGLVRQHPLVAARDPGCGDRGVGPPRAERVHPPING